MFKWCLWIIIGLTGCASTPECVCKDKSLSCVVNKESGEEECSIVPPGAIIHIIPKKDVK